MKRFEDYNAAMAYIEEKNKLGSVPGLDNITELLDRLGNPQDGLKVLHIAGTNGKGSIFAYVQKGLTKAGYRVGRYVSPTISCYLERFQINDSGEDIRYMREEEFADILGEVAADVEKMVTEGLASPTAFEIETAVAFAYFKKMRCDYVLIECGMGGRLDATNVMKKPEIVAFASISMDHMQFLGDTIEKIATEKSGIIKTGCNIISAPQEKAARKVIIKRCSEMNADVTFADAESLELIDMDVDKMTFSYKGEIYETNLIGEFQLANASTAIEIMRSLNLTDDVIKYALKNTTWRGRFTVISHNPLVVVDGAHNEAAWLSLRDTLSDMGEREKIFIIGVLADKEYEKMADILCPLAKYVVTVTPENPRALAKEKLGEVISKHGVAYVTADNVDDAFAKALEKRTTANDMVVVCGSLSFLKPYIEFKI